MHDYKAMNVFATVVEKGSMQAAANTLSMTPSAITQSLQKLEQQLNMKLLNRTTRKISLTEAGEVFYQHIHKMLKNADNAMKSLDILRSNPSGQLNIACVTGLMDSQLTRVFQSVLAQHPEFQLNIRFEDKVADLLEQRVDIALRAGHNALSDNMIARHLYDFTWKIVAHPSYIEQKGMPQTLEELAELDWIGFSHPKWQQLDLTKGSQSVQLPINYRIHCNTLYATRCLTINGLGVSVQPNVDVSPAFAGNHLIDLFSDWQLPTTPLYLVTLQRIQSEKVRIASELIVEYFEQLD